MLRRIATHRKAKFGFVGMLLLGWFQFLPTQTGAAGSPLANREHPRIWITKETLPTFRAKLSGPFRDKYQAWVSSLDSVYDRIHTDKEYVRDALNYSFIYHIGALPGIRFGHATEEYGAKAKQLLLQAAAKGDTWRSLPVAYDWTYDLMSPAERTTVVNYFKTIREPKVTNPLDDGETLARLMYILAGLAFANDGIDDALAAKMLNRFNELQPAGQTPLSLHNYIAPDGGWSHDMSYAMHGGTVGADSGGLVQLMEAWRTANGLTRAEFLGGDKAAVLRYMPAWYLYYTRPWGVPMKDQSPDGYRYVMFRTHHMDATWAPGFGDSKTVLGAVRLFKEIDPSMAALSEWLLQNRTGDVEVTGQEGRREALFGNFLFGESVAPRSPMELGLPLTKIFRGLGWVFMRTGWDRTDTVVSLTAATWNRYSGGYSNLNQGTFTIDRLGPLVVNSGNNSHHGYSNSTWAGNTIIFPDSSFPEGTTSFPKNYDAGGQRMNGLPEVTNRDVLMPGGPNDIGGITRYQPADGSDVDYVFTDLTRAYNGPTVSDRSNAPKVALFTRQLVYFRRTSEKASDRIVVFDRTRTTDTKYEKRWLLHPVGNLAIDGTERLEREGKWVYTGANRLTGTNTTGGSNGRMFWTPLLPSNRVLVKIGGRPTGTDYTKGHDFEDPYGNQSYGNLQGSVLRRLEAQYVGEYRVEVRPAIKQLNDVFLNVLEAGDAGLADASSTSTLSGNGVSGARVGDRIAIFSEQEGRLNTGSVSIDRGGSYRVFIADLIPGGEYDINGSRRITATAAGTAYFPFDAPGAGSQLEFRATGSVRPASPAMLLRPGVAPMAPTNVRIVR